MSNDSRDWAIEHFEFFDTSGVFKPDDTAEVKAETVQEIFDKFRDAWRQSSKPTAWKVNWDRAWRTWCQQWPHTKGLVTDNGVAGVQSLL